VTPADRAALVAAVKPKARAVVNCVAAGNARGVALHLDGMDPHTAALVIVLAAAADHTALAAVCATRDDGMPGPDPRREARAEDAARKQAQRAVKAAETGRVAKARIAARAAEIKAGKQRRVAA
jgi:hypothetical protein